MKKQLLNFLMLFSLALNGYSQVTIATWESGTSPAFAGYPTTVIPSRMENPSKTGINTSNYAERLTSLSGNNYELAYTNPSLSYIDFTNVNSISVKVYSSVAGKVRLQLEKAGDGSRNKYVDAYYFTPGVWQELKFNFYFSAANNNWYNLIVIMPDLENDSRSNYWYFDDIKTVMSSPFNADIISDFDNTIRSFEKQDNSTVTWADNPSVSGINTSSKVMQIATNSQQYEGAMCLIENKFDFTNKNTILLKVYSDIAGPIWLEIRNSSNPAVKKVASGYYFTPGKWQEIKFNYYTTSADNNIYDAVIVYPDYSGTVANNWYIDEVSFIYTTSFSDDVISDFDNVIRSFVSQDNAIVTWADNPSVSGINTSSKVMQMATTSQQYEGAMCLMESKFDFIDKNTISLKVYSNVEGPIWLEIRNSSNPTVNKVVSGYYFTAGEWQEIKFNYYTTSADNNIYDAVLVYPDYSGTGANNWYIDDVNFTYTPPFTDDVISNFDNIIRNFEDYTLNGILFPVVNPNSDAINSSANCLKLTTDTGKYENIKVTLDSKFDFSNYRSNFINIMVYSSVGGRVVLKLMGPGGVEYIAETKNYSAPNSWQQLSFDVTNQETDTYNSITIFPDYEGTGISDWYIDEVMQYHPADINLYSNWEDITLPFTAIGDNNVSQTANPDPSGEINSSANVLRLTTTSQTNEGAKTELDNYMDYSISAIYTVKVYSTSTGPVLMKLEGTGVSPAEVSVDYTTAGHWQLLTFNFGLDITTDIYNMLSILPDYASTVSGNWYIDDLSGPGLAPSPVVLEATYANWESISPALETWLDLTTSVTINPFDAGINQSAYALQANTNDETYEGFAFTIPGVFDFSAGTAFTLNVLSDHTGQVKFKIESPYGVSNVEIDAQYTKSGVWQQLVYTFDDDLPSAFNKIAIFPDFGGTSTSQWYFDNIQGPVSVQKAIYLTGIIAENREDGKEISVHLIGDTFDSVLDQTNWVATGLPGDVSIDSVIRINDTLALVTLSENSTGQSIEDIIFTITIDQDEFSSGLDNLTAEMRIIALGDYSEERHNRVFVHYMPWYNIEATDGLPAYGMWRNPSNINEKIYANEPLIGEYSQLDEDVLEYHFLTMYAAGIDGIIININPSNSNDVTRTKSILKTLALMNAEYSSTGFSIKYIISYDNKYLRPADYQGIYNNLKFVRDSLINNPEYRAYRFDDDKTGYPVLLTWSHLGDQDTTYHNVIEDLYNDSVIYIKRDANDFASANATFQWINYLRSDSTRTEHVYWGEDYYQDFDSAMANQQNIPAGDRIYLTMGAVWPGFDDTNIPEEMNWSGDRWMNRVVDSGETMSLTFDKLNNYLPGATGPVMVELPWIQVVTWNDWPEGTTIEPATEETYGYKALLTTMIKAAEFKGHTVPGSADSIGVTIPYEIYKARKVGDMVTANCILNEFLAGNYETAINFCSPEFNILLDVPYSQAESETLNGAACAKMILDYEASNTITQSTIHSYGTGVNYPANTGADFIDPYGMYRSLNYFELDYRYNYDQLTRDTKEEAYRDMCYWISISIPNTSREHLPSLVPINGGFDEWFVVDGFQSSANPQLQSDYEVYGFYVTDPRYDGVGHKMFIQANTFGASYFLPVSSTDIWNGKYVSVNEPPANNGTISVEPEREFIEPTTNDLRYQIVEYAFNDYNLADKNVVSEVFAAGYIRDRIYFVDLEGTLYDYYIVSYTRTGANDVIIVAVIDANNGALKLLSYNNEPDYGYYNYLDNYTSYARLKSTDNKSKNNNLLYPVKGAVNLADETNKNNINKQESRFEIMPNPVKDFAFISYNIDRTGLVNIRINDVSGETIMIIAKTHQDAGYHNLEINLQDLDNGLYFVSFVYDNITSVKRLIVNK